MEGITRDLERAQLSSQARPTKSSGAVKLVHTLLFKYPDADLLEDGVQPYLAPPTSADIRRAPSEVACHAERLGTQFFAFLFLRPHSPFNIYYPQQGEGKQLRERIELLRGRPGRSQLNMVSYLREEYGGSHVWHRFLLTNLEDDHALDLQFDLSAAQYRHIVMNRDAEQEEWVDILADLVSRASDRAFFEVRKNLMSTHSFVAMQEAAEWNDVWERSLPKPIIELFLSRLQQVTEADAERLFGAADGRMDLQLPCGHQIGIRKIEIAGLIDHAMLTKKQRVEEVDSYKARNASWVCRDNGLTANGEVVKFKPGQLIEALESALNSFDAPATITPVPLNPVHWSETRAVMAHLETIIGNSDDVLESRPADLLFQLIDTAKQATRVDPDERGLKLSETVVPPEYSSFERLWFTRAVSFLAQRLELEETTEDWDELEEQMELSKTMLEFELMTVD
ncbi:uncharacterized protein LTR77_005795 [Saxophila tyrrhenica]|uniref:Uncharacterized protein n=1 Tax=Saxophila tyrrhenica TaxID=1690608 RepID=A0AAV9PDJ6_9PEZI|nr:hypothetical protein LTR77_005795 [Saxophila tyrrhenica]